MVESDETGVDYRWVMETTFVLAILIGAPAVAVTAAVAPVDSFAERAGYAIRVGALAWVLIAVGVFLVARHRG